MSSHKPIFFFEGATDLDMYLSYTKLKKHGYNLYDISRQLADRDTKQFSREIATILDGDKGYFLLGTPSYPASPVHPRYEQYSQNIAALQSMPNVVTLQHDGITGGMSVFAQVCALLIGGYEPSKLDFLASAFISDYVNGAYCANATKEEVKWLALVDRRCRGIAHVDENIAAQFVKNETVYAIASEFPTYEFRTANSNDDIWREPVRQVLVDYAFIEQQRGTNVASALFTLVDENNDTLALMAYTDSTRCIHAITKACERHGYDLSSTVDKRTGLHVLTVAKPINGASIGHLIRCFWDPVNVSTSLDCTDEDGEE